MIVEIKKRNLIFTTLELHVKQTSKPLLLNSETDGLCQQQTIWSRWEESENKAPVLNDLRVDLGWIMPNDGETGSVWAPRRN